MNSNETEKVEIDLNEDTDEVAGYFSWGFTEAVVLTKPTCPDPTQHRPPRFTLPVVRVIR